jgi:Carboxypeptidase regulatory-like domain/Bacterial Ig-like domain (group 2)
MAEATGSDLNSRGFVIALTTATMVAMGAMAAACGHNAANPAAPTGPGPSVSSIAVTSAPVSNASVQMTAMARLSDGSSQDVTRSAAWESSNPAVATVSPTGMVSVVGAGELDVRATYQNVSGSMHLRVGSVPVSAVTIVGAPAGASTPFQLTAMARLVDGSMLDVTGRATWQSSNTQLATVSSTGVVTVVGTGDVDLQATYQSVSGSIRVFVSHPTTAAMTGHVVEAGPDARPVAGARVQILEGSNALSDDRGAFALRGIPMGRVIIEVSKAGYETWSNMLDLENDVDLTVPLTPMAGAAKRTPAGGVSSGSAR